MILTTGQAILAAALDPGDPGSWAAQTQALAVTDRLAAVGAHVCFDGCTHPSHAVPLAAEARTRITDPATSRAAADSIDNLTERQAGVLAVAQSLSDPWTYDRLVWTYRRRYADGHDLPAQEPQSIRTRAKELREGGWITCAGVGEADTGRPAKLWQVVRRMEAVA